MSTTTTCAHCADPAVALVDGVPVCRDHLEKAQREFAARDDRMYAEEAARLGIEIPPAVLRDREFGPACWLLSSPTLARRAWRFVHVDRRRIDWDELLEASKPWSHYERRMVLIALNLWNGDGGGPEGEDRGAFSLYDLAGFDRHNWQRVMEALAMAKGKRLLTFDPPELTS